MNREYLDLLYQLHNEMSQYTTTRELGLRLGVSAKTVSRRLNQLKQILPPAVAVLDNKRGQGCRLIIKDLDKYNALVKRDDNRPATPEDRVKYLLQFFLYSSDFVKIQTLADKLYISNSQLTKDLRAVKKFLNRFGLVLESRPGYGLHVTGTEGQKRSSLTALYSNDLGQYRLVNLQDYELVINKIITDVLAERNMRMSDLMIRTVGLHLLIAIERVISGNEIKTVDENTKALLAGREEYTLAAHFADRVNEVLHVKLSDGEISNLARRLFGRRQYQSLTEIDLSDEKARRVAKFFNTILKTILKQTGIDFYADRELRENLQLHIVTLLDRLDNQTTLTNPLVDEIKAKYSFAFELASIGLYAAMQTEQKQISEDEISLVALHLALALDRKQTMDHQINIVIICSSGKASSQLIAYQLQQKFPQIRTIKILDAIEAQRFDYTMFDIGFTTIPLTRKITIPIHRIPPLLNNEWLAKIRTWISDSPNDHSSSLFDQKFFFTDVAPTNRADVLKQITAKLAKIVQLPEHFYASLMEREAFASTEIGNKIAIPHPNTALSPSSFIAVTVLSKPMVWSDKQVQIIFLISLSHDQRATISQSYKQIVDFAMSPGAIEKLLANPSYDNMKKIFAEASQD